MKTITLSTQEIETILTGMENRTTMLKRALRSVRRDYVNAEEQERKFRVELEKCSNLVALLS